ncbi:MAG: TIR domain-containing protein, partial [Acholeplasma sp.]|nr:TIR domain-containing protein [Acholeplasma sp.]
MAEALICTQCGSHKLKSISESRYMCDSCGTTTDVTLYNDDIGLKLSIAMTTRQTAKFDEAKVLYEQIKSTLKPDQIVPEVYFGLFACDYKVLFELDNRTGNRVPIFYSSSESNVFDNHHLKKALEQARDISFSKFQEYNELANKVESARMLYQKLAKLVTPFDIFICFKKTDLDGISDTRDFSIAMSLYLNLVNKFPKYKIFFSEKTLAEIPLTEYEPNIYYALHTSKILMVVSSKRDYLESQWVKNEWTRFLAINKANAIIPIYLKGSGVNIFPSEILKNNAYEEGDYERIFKSIDAIMNSEKIIKEREQEEEKRRKQLIDEVEKRFSKSFNIPNTNLTNMFKRLINDLSDGMFESAQKTCDAIFNIDAEHPLAWLYSYLIEKKLTSLDLLSSQYESNWVEDRSIRKAIDFSKLDSYDDERVKIEEELYKWIKYMVTEAIDLRDRKKYDDARSKLVKVATHVEEFGQDQRFYYFYQTFLLELNCTNTNDIVSLMGIEKNTNFSKALLYATDNQQMQLQEVIHVAKNNASQYQEQIESNNLLLTESINKLEKVSEEKIAECYNLIKMAKDDEKEAKLNIKKIEEKINLEKEEVFHTQEQIKKHKEELLLYYDSFSEKITRFIYNLR